MSAQESGAPWRAARTENIYQDFPTRAAAREFARRMRVYGPVAVGRAPAEDRPARQEPRRRGRSSR